ncbi:restriction endonuclease [Pseudoalteromonas distincta]|uniref:Restriction endonuclease n=1 Tax=Pseudoalteromonas distincta TaxID=77608 RepID=A0A4V1HDD3_9GAMM|nr:restriction endonuclease [Pseudoalteromonas distincta]QCU74375.1 restriction endonuclease [Pseudoalteromonas distincta]
MNWKEYEIYITKHFQSLFPETSIQHDVRREGLMSKVKRQIDILIEGRIAGFDLKIVVDCKYFNKKVDVKAVESFLSFLQDLKVSKGILITNHGYTKAAYNRAMYDSQDIELRIINFDDLEKFQSFMAIPYSKSECAIVTSPDGWVVDAVGQERFVASFYAAGLTQEEAFHTEGFIYMAFSHKDKQWPDLPDLLRKQELTSKQHYHLPKIEYINTIKREDCNLILRVLDAKEMGNTIEYTLFLDYPRVIIYLTLLTDATKEKQYLKKLEWIGEKLIKGNVIFDENCKPLNVKI